MLKERAFRIVWVAAGHGVGVSSTTPADSVIHCTGNAVPVAYGGNGTISPANMSIATDCLEPPEMQTLANLSPIVA